MYAQIVEEVLLRGQFGLSTNGGQGCRFGSGRQAINAFTHPIVPGKSNDSCPESRQFPHHVGERRQRHATTSSRIRASNLAMPTIPTFRPKLRSVPRRSFSMSVAFASNNCRLVSSIRRFWLANVLTCTGRHRPTRIMCAMPRASLRSLLLSCAYPRNIDWQVTALV
jgi:hypothetical protein